MNDVLVVERLITAYNNKYSIVKVGNYGLNEQKQSSLPDKIIQRGMERILSEAVHFKFGLTNTNQSDDFVKSAEISFPQNRS